MVEEDTRWITAVQAAEITGLSATLIAHAARRGIIQLRPKPRKGRPSLDRSSVIDFARRRRQAEECRESRRALAREDRRAASAPPQDGHEWLTTGQAAALLGRSRSGVGLMIRDERMPATKVGRRWWIRRDHMEQILAAMRFRAEAANARAVIR